MTRALLAGVAALMAVAPAEAQHAGHDMPEMQQAPPAAGGAADPHAGHVMPPPAPAQPAPGDPHAGHDMGVPAGRPAPTGTDLPAGDAAAPIAFPGLAASRVHGAQAMADADRKLRREHGGGVYDQMLFNLAEAQFRNGRDGYRWDGEAWIGGDIDRLAIKTEGSGEFGRSIESAELQLLYSRALDPYVSLQAGIRQDFGAGPSRRYASIGVEALAPYFFDVEGTVFLSDRGDVLVRAEAYYDQRITNWFVLQPRAELTFAAQDMPADRIGSGLSDVELGLRLRYEIRREFAPYIGISWDRKLGDGARFARLANEETGGFSLVAGVRTWF